ncbi:hypothetical protein, partial [Chamaesiphon sp. OTE_8_metabat_110]|uniref:hypothetical protein n=1 Tax=Chamaesiphon sp. OTE_8_metabat_110 TaxID=2964696 RepID=UPI00286BA045
MNLRILIHEDATLDLHEHCNYLAQNNQNSAFNFYPLNRTSPAPVLANKERTIEPKIRHPTKLKLPIRVANNRGDCTT